MTAPGGNYVLIIIRTFGGLILPWTSPCEWMYILLYNWNWFEKCEKIILKFFYRRWIVFRLFPCPCNTLLLFFKCYRVHFTLNLFTINIILVLRSRNFFQTTNVTGIKWTRTLLLNSSKNIVWIAFKIYSLLMTIVV